MTGNIDRSEMLSESIEWIWALYNFAQEVHGSFDLKRILKECWFELMSEAARSEFASLD